MLELIKWGSLILALAIFAWWLFGNSPTTEQVISLGFPLLFLFLALEGRLDTKRVHSEQTKVLNKIYGLMKKK